MGSNPSEKVDVFIDLKDHAISFCDPCFPNRLVPFHFLHIERRVLRVFYKLYNLFVYLVLDVLRKPFIIPFKGLCE